MLTKVQDWSGRDELLKILGATTVKSGDRMADLRSAIVFTGLNGKRIGVVYFGRFFGRYLGETGAAQGAIGNRPVLISGKLSAWLKQMIPPTLQ